MMAKKSHIKNTIKESFRMAIEAIRQNKLRSILTLLGISIGVFSVIGVMTAIRTLESSVNSQLGYFWHQYIYDSKITCHTNSWGGG